MGEEKIVECINLEKKYFLFEKDYKIIPWLFTKKGCSKVITPLKNINLTINKGDVIGFIGKNGAGKSTLMKIIAGITMHTSGSLTVNGQVNSLINLGAGFNPKYTGRENIYYKGLLMGMNKEKVDSIIDEIIDFCELGDYFDLPLYMYSSGMSARLGFALAIFAEHDILIVDEVFAVGDKMFREKSAKKMTELFRSGKSIIFASHSDDQIRQFCNRAIFIDESRIVVDGTVEEALDAYNKKYDPSRVKPPKISNEIQQNEIVEPPKNIDRLMAQANEKQKMDRAEICRELALFFELEGEIDLAYELMYFARAIRPNGPFIVQKMFEYEEAFGKREISGWKTLDDTNRIRTYINMNFNILEADIYREIALFCEMQDNYQLAYKYMSIAKELRPTGPYICSKVEEYKLKV